MILLLVPVLGLAVVVGVNFGWRWVLAPLLAYVLLRWSISSLRALATDAGEPAGEATAEGDAIEAGKRTYFWCEECGTEVLLLVRGTSRGPSHCGQRMHERTELPN